MVTTEFRIENFVITIWQNGRVVPNAWERITMARIYGKLNVTNKFNNIYFCKIVELCSSPVTTNFNKLVQNVHDFTEKRLQKCLTFYKIPNKWCKLCKFK